MKKDLSLEELMLIAKKPVKENQDGTKHLSPAKRFIVACNLKSEKSFEVPAFIIYDRYVKWANTNNIRPVGQNVFFKEFKLYFESVKRHQYSFYRINPEGFDLSAENKALLTGKRNSNGKKEKTKKS